MMFLVLIKSN